MAVEQALVLGGGGVAGVAWITGLLAGLADVGQDVTTGTDLVIGTSAGATVAAQLGSGLSLAALFARQVDPALQSREIMAEVDWAKYAELQPYLEAARTPAERLRRFGEFALNAQTVPESERRAVIESRLASPDWPVTATRLIAVDCVTGELAVFDASSGIPLTDAVAASCAVPGIWPPVTISGRRYLDGGVRSRDNADLAAGAARITVISPLGLNSPLPAPMPLADVLTSLKDGGAVVTLLSPDEASRAAIGLNSLDPATREPAATAGRVQGRAGLPPAF